MNAPSQPVWEITNKAAVPESPSLTVTRDAPAEPPSQDAPLKPKDLPEPSTADAAPAPAPATTQDAPPRAPLSSPELRRVSTPPLDAAPSPKPDASDAPKKDASSPRKRHGGAAAAADGPIETLTYRDPFAGVYKKYIFSADGKYLLGGMMVGDTSDYVKLVALVKKKVSERG
jgi:nitrite reductase (NAD(P)H)